MRTITTIHGAGGKEMQELIRRLIISKVPLKLRSALGGVGTDVLDDGATIKLGSNYLVVATDSFTVNPIKFPGGDIGHLAACGVINDVVMMGAKPFAALDTLVIEEGVEEGLIDELINSFVNILVSNDVALIGGDLKVMPRGSIDKVVITATCLGLTSKEPIVDKLVEGDKIIVTGPIAEHGATILAAQLGMLNEVKGLRSDSKALTKTLLPILDEFREYIHAARDPTRGGLASVLNEWVEGSEYTIFIRRGDVPLRDEVKYFLDAVGVDPLNVACEGVAVLAVSPEVSDDVVKELRKLGEIHASVIGEVVKAPNELLRGKVVAITEVGGKTLVRSEPLNLPRIC